jgi:DNA-binding CsgD family transcriptional regulator
MLVTRMRSDDPLVGRANELEQLAAVVDDPRLSGQVVLITGEAGIGKSRLLKALAQDLGRQGWATLIVGADELERAVPYAGLRDAVAAIKSTNRRLAELTTRLVQTLNVAEECPPSTVTAVASEFVTRLTELSPMLLGFDDLELTDDDTIMLVARLLRLRPRHPVVMVGNVRTPQSPAGSRFGAFLERARRDGLLHEMELGPLAEPAVHELVSRMIEDDPGPNLVSAVYQASGGIPLYAIHTVRNLTETDDISAEDLEADCGGAEFPGDRRRSFLDRVLRLGEAGRRLARAIALLGVVGPSRLQLAAELAGLDASEAERPFDSLVERGVLRTTADGSYRISHQLLQDALYQEIGPAERWHWHRIVADWLATLPSSPGIDLELASHLREIAEPGDDQAISALWQAGNRACKTAPRSAVPWFERTLAITPAADPRRGQVFAMLARAEFLAGRPGASITAGREALAALDAGESRSRLASLVIDALVLVGALDRAAELVDAELQGAPASLRLVAKATHIYTVVGRVQDARTMAQAVEQQLPTAGLREEILALGHLARMMASEPHFDELPTLWHRLEELATDAPVTAQLAAFAAIAKTAAITGMTARATASLEQGNRLLSDVGWTFFAEDLAVAQAQTAGHLGDWSRALEIIDSLDDELELSGSLSNQDALRTLKIEILANRGQWLAARETASHPVPENPMALGAHTWATAAVPLLSGDLQAARAALTSVLRLGTVPRWCAPLLMSRLGDIEIDAGNPQRALELLSDHYDPHLLERMLPPTSAIPVRLTYGRASGSVDALGEALAVAEEHGLALLRGRALLYLGMADVDPQRNLGAAARVFRSLEATPWRRKAVTELRRRGLKVPRERSSTHGLLSETETQIARLVQHGRSNREIATTLFLSVKTVEGYLSRIYSKAGCSNRLELARAMDSGLIDP